MSDEGSSSGWKRSLTERALDWAGGAFFTLLASLAFFFFTSESPELTYEVFPPSSFVSEQTERTIYTVRVANQGDAEAEEVRTVFDFPNGATVQDSKVNASSEAITYTLVDTSTSATREYTFPLLNPGESAKFSFLLSGRAENIDVAVRGHGVVGEEREDEQHEEGWVDIIIAAVGGVSLLYIMGLLQRILIKRFGLR